LKKTKEKINEKKIGKLKKKTKKERKKIEKKRKGKHCGLLIHSAFGCGGTVIPPYHLEYIYI
jgi:exopolyphosphatase/pppGpp-phosphohydrolase